MFQKLLNLPIRHKLTLIVLGTTGLLIGILATGITVERYYSLRQNIIEDITTLSNIIGTNSTAALAFNDNRTAKEILSALKAENDIIAAVLFDAGRRSFASYHRLKKHPQNQNPSSDLAATVKDLSTLIGQSSSIRLGDDVLDLGQSIRLDGKIVGYIAIRTDLNVINRAVTYFVLSMIGLSLLLFVAAHFICARLNLTIIGPITNLVNTMQTVSRHQDYSVRVSQRSTDEVGLLIGGFNDMLAQIQKREHELGRHRDHLEELVEQRTRELKHSNQKLLAEIDERKAMEKQLAHAQKMEAIGTLAGGVAHDLNNILSGVVSYPEILLMNMPAGDPMRKPLQTIQTSGNKAAAIVQDLLTLARRGVKVEEVVDLAALIREYLTSPEYNKLLTFYSKVYVKFTVGEGLQCVKGSPVHLSKTIMNLVSNAVEAMPSGGRLNITLTNVKLKTPLPGFKHWRPGPYVLLTISDSGIGIPEKNLHRIFEPFFTNKIMGRSGTGLGMAVVWGTIEDHKGHITLESREGKGTTFDIYLPVALEETAPQAPYLPEKPAKGEGQRILVVDDSAEQRHFATEILTSLGYKAASVASGEEALQRLQKEAFDLIILDMLMPPGIDGLETYRQIIQIQPGQKALIVSGFSESDRVGEARRLGVNDYVLKPYSLNQISKAIKSALAGT